MNKRLLNFLISSVLILAIISSCQKINDPDTDDDTDDPSDYTWDTSSVAHITLNGTSVTVDPSNAAVVSGSKVTIKSAGTYNIAGTLTDGQIIVNTKDDSNVRLLLDGVNITCSNSAPLFISDTRKTIICLTEGTQNYLTDGTTYVTVDGEPSAALFSNSNLVLFGRGSLTVNAKYNDGISGDDGLLIKSGTYSVTAADDGIRGKDYFIIKNGNITVSSKGDGMKSDNESDGSRGYVIIDSATVKITSSCDAISAYTNVVINSGTFTLTAGGGSSGTVTSSAKAIKGLAGVIVVKGTFAINSADDAIHSHTSVKINGGSFSVATKDAGIHCDATVEINDGNMNITKCWEGIEGSAITMNGGYVSLVSTDDGINGTMGSRTEANDGSQVIINGGTLVINSSSGDGLDSNGSAVITGGTIIIHGPASQPEVAFDINGAFNISGGFFIATGPNSGNMIEVPSTSSSQYSVKATSSATLTSSTLFHFQDASGNEIVTYKPVRNTYYLVVSAPALANGSSYSIYTGGSSTGTLTNGVYAGGTYSGGTLKKTFTISGKISSVSF